jgi:hypothetical protein
VTWTDLNEMPYCDTFSKPDFQTSVTSQALVACRRHDRKADTAFPPTEHTLTVRSSSISDILRARTRRKRAFHSRAHPQKRLCRGDRESRVVDEAGGLEMAVDEVRGEEGSRRFGALGDRTGVGTTSSHAGTVENQLGFCLIRRRGWRTA